MHEIKSVLCSIVHVVERGLEPSQTWEKNDYGTTLALSLELYYWPEGREFELHPLQDLFENEMRSTLNGWAKHLATRSVSAAPAR